MTDKQHTVSVMAVALLAASDRGGSDSLFARDALDLYEAVEAEIAKRDEAKRSLVANGGPF